MGLREASNDEIADTLESTADLLELLHKNPFRVRSYREAARIIRTEDESVAERLPEGDGEWLKVVRLPEYASRRRPEGRAAQLSLFT